MGRKLPVLKKRNENDEKKIIEKQNNGGLSENTKKRRKGVNKVFDEAQELNGKPSLKELCSTRNKAGLETDLQGFFESYFISLDDDIVTEDKDSEDKVLEDKDQEDKDQEDEIDTGDQVDLDLQIEIDELNDGNFDKENCQRPKGNTSLTYKSHLKMLILEFTENEFNISNKVQFPNFDVSTYNLIYWHFRFLFTFAV